MLSFQFFFFWGLGFDSFGVTITIVYYCARDNRFVRVKNQNDISKFISRKNKEKENKENAKERILKARDVTLNKHGNQGSAGNDEL